MDNSSYRSQYIQAGLDDSEYSEASAAAVISVWNRIARAEEQIGKSIENGYTKDDYIKLFNALNITSPYTLKPTKSRLKKYLEWLIENGTDCRDTLDALVSVSYKDLVAKNIYEEKYFKDFGSLQSAIEETLYIADKVDDNVFALQISAIYMAWCGLTAEEALSLLKSDVGENDIRVGDRVVSPVPTIMRYLQEYRDATEYESKGRGILTLKYVPSKYLFRTARSAHLDSTKTLRIMINTFTNSSDGLHTFNYNKVYWSGIFHCAYLYECANGELRDGDIETLGKLFNESYQFVSVANDRLREYRSFKSFFFPDHNT